MNPKVDAYLDKAGQWQDEMKKIRKIILSCGLAEDIKWGKPCYSSEGKNIVIIQGFRQYLAVLFFKGYLLSDPDGILVKTGENTVVGRQIRFNDAKEIVKQSSVLKAYIYEALELEKAGTKAPPRQKEILPIPEEFQQKLQGSLTLKNAFSSLTPGRQRAYIYHFSQPKQSATKVSRIEKHIPQILKGKGLND